MKWQQNGNALMKRKRFKLSERYSTFWSTDSTVTDLRSGETRHVRPNDSIADSSGNIYHVARDGSIRIAYRNTETGGSKRRSTVRRQKKASAEYARATEATRQGEGVEGQPQIRDSEIDSANDR